MEYMLYLTTSLLDITFGVCMCTRYQSNSKESYYNVVKQILKYLKGTTNVRLWYLGGVSLNLVYFFYSDFTSCKLDKKSKNGICHLLESSLVSWHNRK